MATGTAEHFGSVEYYWTSACWRQTSSFCRLEIIGLIYVVIRVQREYMKIVSLKSRVEKQLSRCQSWKNPWWWPQCHWLWWASKVLVAPDIWRIFLEIDQVKIEWSWRTYGCRRMQWNHHLEKMHDSHGSCSCFQARYTGCLCTCVLTYNFSPGRGLLGSRCSTTIKTRRIRNSNFAENNLTCGDL